MNASSRLALLLVLDIIFCFVLSYVGLWYFVLIPSAVLGFFVSAKWRNLAYFGITGAFGALIPIFISQSSYRLDTASLVSSVIGLPGGFAVPLALTALLLFLVSGLGAMVTSSLR